MKSGAWQDEARETNAFTILDKPQPEPLIHFYLLETLCSCVPAARRGAASILARYGVRSDGQRQEIQTPRAPRSGGGEQTKLPLLTTCKVC